MQQAFLTSTLFNDGCESSIEEILESYDSYIVALSMEWVCQHATCVHPALLDLEIDELAQKARIKFWQVLKEKEIHYPKAYIKHIVHSEFIDMMRRHKPNVPLSEDEEGEIYRGKVLVSASKEMVDPAEVIEEQDEVNNRLEEVLKAILDLPKCQRRVMICSLRERVDDELALARALRHHNLDINQWQWPQDKQEKQRLRASLSYVRRSIANKLKNVPVLRKYSCFSKVNTPRVSQSHEENQSRAHSFIPSPPTPSTLTKEDNLMEQKNTQQELANVFMIEVEADPVKAESERDIDALPEPYRTALFLHYVEKQSYPEMAAQLNLPLGTVKSHVNRGNKLLQTLVSQKGENSKSDNACRQEHDLAEMQDMKERLHLLAEPYKTALFLHYIEKQSYPEMAAQLNLPVGTVKSHVSRGKKMLLTNTKYHEAS